MAVRSISPVALVMPESIYLLMLIFVIIGQVTSQKTMVKVYDVYGDEADMVHYGSTVEFQCDCTKSWCQTSSAPLDLMLDGIRINSTKDKRRSEVTKFSVRVNDQLQFGRYQCVMGNDTWASIILEYHLCADHHPSCQRSGVCEGKFCIIRKSGLHSCSSPISNECGIHRLTTCTTDNKMVGSPCAAHARNLRSMMTSSTTYATCDKPHLFNFRNEAGQDIAHGSTVYLRPETKIQIKCGGDIRSIIVLEEKGIDRTAPLWTRRLNCQDFVPFNEHEVNREKFFKTKLSARTTVNQDETIKTYFYVVSLENPVLMLSLRNGTECAPDAASPHFSCGVQNYEAQHLKYLRVSLKVSHVVIGELNSTVGQLSLYKIPVVAAGKYTCRAEVVYRTCSPFTEHKVEGAVEGHLHKSCLPMNVKSEYVRVIESDPTNSMILYCAIGGLSVIAAVAICVITVFLYTRSLRLKRERLRQPELEQTLIESDAKNRNLILDGEALFALSQHLMVSTSDYENAKEYADKNLGPCEPDPKGSRRDSLSKTQYLNTPCYVHAKVVAMNVSRTVDWKMKPLIVAVLPKPPDFARFWELIVSDKIGTVLWIGDFAAGSKTLIDAYICRMANGSRELNEQRFCLMVRIRTVSVLKFDKYAIYTIKFQFKKGSVKTFGLVTVIHVLIWPVNQVPPYTSSFQITEICSTIETYQQKRGAKWSGVLIHDSCSLERSAAMAALIICRQIYVERRRINFLAVLKYVRAARLGCFNTRANGHVQMALVATCLAALAKSIQEEVAAEQKNSKSKSDNSVFGDSKRSQNLKKSSTYTPFLISKSPSAAATTTATSTALLPTSRKQSTAPVSTLTKKSVIPSKQTQSVSKPSSGSQDMSLDV